MRMIDKIVETLTEEERERFKDLIEECRKREKDIKASTNRGLEVSKKLAETFSKMNLNLDRLKNNVNRVVQFNRQLDNKIPQHKLKKKLVN